MKCNKCGTPISGLPPVNASLGLTIPTDKGGITVQSIVNLLFQSVSPNPVMVSIDTDYIVTNEDYIQGVDGITVMLPVVGIKPITIVGTSGTIIIDGNGSTIDGQLTVSLTNGNSYTLVPFAGDWRIV